MLTVSIKTVQAHRAHIMEKLNVHDKTDLVKYAIRMGLINAE
jgi:DNA-binding NarL/FixJ family response regulator